MLRPWILIAATAAGLDVSQHYSRDEAAQALVELRAAGAEVAAANIYAVQNGELVLSELVTHTEE